MKKIILLGFIGMVASVVSAADSSSKEKVANAAKQLGDKTNYSWASSTKEADGSPGRLGTIEGKAEKAGLVWLGFSAGGIPVEVYMEGQKGAAKALEGWQTFEEVAQAGGTAEAIVKYLRAYKAPVAESARLAGNVKEFKEVEGAWSGELKEEAAKELLLFGARRREGQEAPKTENVKGSVKFWIQDGTLTKYEINVQGKLTAGERESEINRTTTVEIKDAGTTKMDLPAEAKQKLG